MDELFMRQRYQENFHPSGMMFLTDVTEAKWVERETSRDSRNVDALIPAVFAAHVRIFHPAESVEGSPVRWSDVAEWAGRRAHPLMEFLRISTPADGFGMGPDPWKHDPSDALRDQDAIDLARLLAEYTRTAEQCFFGVWEGYGQFGAGSMFILSADGGVPLFPPPEVLSAERFECDGWEYFLYGGPLASLDAFFADGRLWGDAPNIWWPADRSWFVMSHYDLDCTYVAGSDECILALLQHPSFEAMPIAADAPWGWGQDRVNLP